MKRMISLLKQGGMMLAFSIITCNSAWATPSTTYWTPCTIDIQSYKVGHVTYDNYTSFAHRGVTRGGSAFPNDLGLTVGVLPFEKLQMEVGFDWVEPFDYPLSFNAKIGAPEGALFNGAPALQFGVFNAGTKTNITNYDIFYFVTGRTLPYGLGRLHLSYYVGNKSTLISSVGEIHNMGFMFAYDYGFWSAKSPEGDYNRIVIAADYATGKNALGGGGFGAYYYFTKNIDLLAGPVWFNDATLNGRWKWTTQLDINF